MKTICLVGFGEVGSILAEDLSKSSRSDIVLWDTLFAKEGSSASVRYQQLNLPQLFKANSCEEAVADADLVISAVTAAQAVPAAQAVSNNMRSQAWFLDLNSISPGRKTQLESLVSGVQARFVEAAVMSPIAPKRIATSIFLAGSEARAFLPIARSLGFSGVSLFSEKQGQAAASKMCRSVIVKGMEALVTEALSTARHYGVEQSVLSSLGDLFPHPDWNEKARYLISRSVEHGGRRAEEMVEVAQTIREAGIDPCMSNACVVRQQATGELSNQLVELDLPGMLDRIIGSSSASSKEEN